MDVFDVYNLGEHEKRMVQAYADHQEAVIRILSIYPHKVAYDAMNDALGKLGYNLYTVYMWLAEGNDLPELDELLDADWHSS